MLLITNWSSYVYQMRRVVLLLLLLYWSITVFVLSQRTLIFLFQCWSFEFKSIRSNSSYIILWLWYYSVSVDDHTTIFHFEDSVWFKFHSFAIALHSMGRARLLHPLLLFMISPIQVHQSYQQLHHPTMLRSIFLLLILIKFILFNTYDDSINWGELCYYYKYIRQYTILLRQLLLLLTVLQYTSSHLYFESRWHWYWCWCWCWYVPRLLLLFYRNKLFQVCLYS